jgi:hypothetical protein
MPPLAEDGYELLSFLSRFVMPSMRKQLASGECEPWLKPLYEIHTGLNYLVATAGIDDMARTSSEGPYPPGELAAALLVDIRNHVLRCTKAVAEHAPTKLLLPHHDRGAFRGKLAEYTKSASSAPQSWSVNDYVPVAVILLTGTELLPGALPQPRGARPREA